MGNLSDNTLRNSWPTAPVTPTTAIQGPCSLRPILTTPLFPCRLGILGFTNDRDRGAWLLFQDGNAARKEEDEEEEEEEICVNKLEAAMAAVAMDASVSRSLFLCQGPAQSVCGFWKLPTIPLTHKTHTEAWQEQWRYKNHEKKISWGWTQTWNLP